MHLFGTIADQSLIYCAGDVARMQHPVVYTCTVFRKTSPGFTASTEIEEKFFGSESNVPSHLLSSWQAHVAAGGAIGAGPYIMRDRQARTLNMQQVWIAPSLRQAGTRQAWYKGRSRRVKLVLTETA
jgi:hypothetical protein